MTIYSHHPHRGKVQILATFRGPSGLTSSTVTSVESVDLAEPIADALNRVSASATIPVSFWDTRHGPVDDFPTDHIAALTDPVARPHLLVGSHSLWYVMATWLLHSALTDLDAALEAAPPPVRTAIEAELETEATWLRSALAEEWEGAEPPARDDERRIWQHEEPFVYAAEYGLGDRDREYLDRHEASFTDAERQQAVDDLRLMLDVYKQRSPRADVALGLEGFDFFVEPIDGDPLAEDRFYLEIGPLLSEDATGLGGWGISLGRWVTDEVDEEGYPIGSTGATFLDAGFSEPPAPTEIAKLLEVTHHQVASWATAVVGDGLDGTRLVVTERVEN